METVFLILTMGVFLHSLLSLVYYKRGGLYRKLIIMGILNQVEMKDTRKLGPFGGWFLPFLYLGWVVASSFAGSLWVVLILVTANFCFGLHTHSKLIEDQTDIDRLTNQSAFLTELSFVCVSAGIILFS
jgi:hypothetical protein